MDVHKELEETLLKNEYKGISGVTCLTDNKPGPNVAVFAVTHGNEIAGMEALKYLLKVYKDSPFPIKGNLFLIVHNIKAFKAYREAVQQREVGVTEFRYLDINLNRIYSDSILQDPEKQHLYEIKRAKEITKIIPEFDYVFDAHSTSAPSTPMLIYYSHEEDMQIAKSINCEKHIINIIDKLNGSPLLEYVKIHGRRKEKTTCFAHEAGFHFEEKAPLACKLAVISFLSQVGCIDIAPPALEDKKNQEYLDVFRTISTHYPDFSWTQTWKSFDEVSKGAVIATENGKDISVEEDCILIMPTAKPKVGAEAVYLSRKI